MKHRLVSAALALIMSFGIAGCELDPPYTGSETQTLSSQTESSSTAKAESKYALNPLTGVYDLNQDAVGKRPSRS